MVAATASGRPGGTGVSSTTASPPATCCQAPLTLHHRSGCVPRGPPHGRLLAAQAKAAVRFETAPGRQLRIDFGEARGPISGQRRGCVCSWRGGAAQAVRGDAVRAVEGSRRTCIPRFHPHHPSSTA